MFVIVCHKNGMTALVLAAMQGNVAMVQLLLKKGANIDLKDAVCLFVVQCFLNLLQLVRSS